MSITEQAVDFEKVDDLLRQCKLEMDAAECHGALCGLLCTLNDMDGSAWVSTVLSGNWDKLALTPADLDQEDHGEAGAVLLAMYRQTREQLNDSSCIFYPMLPDDEVPLAQRAEALAHWSQGFLFGLGLGGVQGPDLLSAEAHEVLSDIAEISRMGGEAGQGGEDDEAAYTEIIEYLRVATLLVCEELRAIRTAQPEGSSVH